MNCIDLFSGVGGMAMGLHGVVNTCAFCETDKFCQDVLCKRFGASFVDVRGGATPYPDCPVFSNVEVADFSAAVRPALRGKVVDMICGGFPCQDISACGHGAGIQRVVVEGEIRTNRSGLFYRAMDWVREFRPTFVFLENVPFIRSRGLDQVLAELTSLGYDCKWGLVSALDVGKPHIRERWFLLSCARAEPARPSKRARMDAHTIWTADAPSPVADRADTGPNYSKVCMALGNAVVPAQSARAFALLCGFADIHALREQTHGVTTRAVYESFRREWRDQIIHRMVNFRGMGVLR